MAVELDGVTLNGTDYNFKDNVARQQIAANVSANTDSNADYAAEVVDARVGADGIQYTSLGNAIRGQKDDTNEQITELKEDLAQLGKYTENELVLVGKWGNKNLYRVNIDGNIGSNANDWNVVYTAPSGKLIVRYELYLSIGNDYWTVNNVYDGVNFIYTAYRNNNTELVICPSSTRIGNQLYGVVWLCDN